MISKEIYINYLYYLIKLDEFFIIFPLYDQVKI